MSPAIGPTFSSTAIILCLFYDVFSCNYKQCCHLGQSCPPVGNLVRSTKCLYMQLQHVGCKLITQMHTLNYVHYSARQTDEVTVTSYIQRNRATLHITLEMSRVCSFLNKSVKFTLQSFTLLWSSIRYYIKFAPFFIAPWMALNKHSRLPTKKPSFIGICIPSLQETRS